MAAEAVYLKEHEGILQSPMGQLSSAPSPALWWAADCGSQSFQPKASAAERTRYGDHFTAPKVAEQGTEQSANKGSVTQFTISCGNFRLLASSAR